MSTPTGFPRNLRDLGGLPLAGGGAVRPGVLFRSDDPGRGDTVSGNRLTAELGIRHVIDLRHAEELDRTRTLGTFVVRDDVVHHPIQLTLRDAVDASGMPSDAAGMGRLYARSIVISASTYVRILETIADADAPALVHCSHGKDRTGIVVALVLSVLGAQHAAIVADFARTGDNLSGMHALARATGISIGLSLVEGIMLEAPAAAMEVFLDTTAREHGGPLGPLRAAGLRPETERRLRIKLADA